MKKLFSHIVKEVNVFCFFGFSRNLRVNCYAKFSYSPTSYYVVINIYIYLKFTQN